MLNYTRAFSFMKSMHSQRYSLFYDSKAYQHLSFFKKILLTAGSPKLFWKLNPLSASDTIEVTN